MESPEIKTERVPREVIDGKLLAALDDQNKVAIVLSESDLAVLIKGMSTLTRNNLTETERAQLDDLIDGFEQLYNEAFHGA